MTKRTPTQQHHRRIETLQRRVDFLAERINRGPHKERHHDRAEHSAISYAIEALNENERLRDLVRFSRHSLLDEGLITEEEFAALLEDGESVRRLEHYDAMRESIEVLHQELRKRNAETDQTLETEARATRIN